VKLGRSCAGQREIVWADSRGDTLTPHFARDGRRRHRQLGEPGGDPVERSDDRNSSRMSSAVSGDTIERAVVPAFVAATRPSCWRR
jgi:hypothetical protein